MGIELIGSIDAGGTTFKCLLATSERKVLARTRVPTTLPNETINACATFFRESAANFGGQIAAIGIASFGPLDVNAASEKYGTILPTPKEGWSNTPLKRLFEQELQVPVAIETDVNAALLAEMKWGAARNASTAAYITVGTGIGVGAFANGQLLARPMHPEFGHIGVTIHSADTDFKGTCAFHGTCLEGLASAPAIWGRFGDPAKLQESDLGTDVIGYYLGQLCHSISLLLRPDAIILGGGVMQNEHILAATRRHAQSLNAGYIPFNPETIVSAGQGDEAGAWGGFLLVQIQTDAQAKFRI
jgi:fructokinase